MKQRGAFSINTIILSALASNKESGLTRTRLMQLTILKHHRIGYYLADLASKGLVSLDTSTKRYRITPKGEKYLRLSEELADYIVPIRGMVSKYKGSLLQNCGESIGKKHTKSAQWLPMGSTHLVYNNDVI